MSSTEPSSVRLAGTLGVAGLISGLVLVAIYLGTLPMIQANQAEALKAAIFRVLPGTASFEAMRVQDGQLAPDPSAEGKPPAPGEIVYAGKNKDGQPVGYAIPAEGNGFMDNIGLIFGFDDKRKVIVGMEVLESRETPGLGDKIILDDYFLSNFKKLAVNPTIVAVKKGEKTEANQVDTITGATISSKAVISILNNAMKIWQQTLLTAATGGAKSGAEAPAPAPPAAPLAREATP